MIINMMMHKISINHKRIERIDVIPSGQLTTFILCTWKRTRGNLVAYSLLLNVSNIREWVPSYSNGSKSLGYE